MQELLALRTIGVEAKHFDDFGLCVIEKGEEICEVQRVFPVVILGITVNVANTSGSAGFVDFSRFRQRSTAGERRNNQRFQALFAGVRGAHIGLQPALLCKPVVGEYDVFSRHDFFLSGIPGMDTGNDRVHICSAFMGSDPMNRGEQLHAVRRLIALD